MARFGNASSETGGSLLPCYTDARSWFLTAWLLPSTFLLSRHLPCAPPIILGSCVTTDAFARDAAGLEEVSYHSRTSFISVNSPPLAIEGSELCWCSNYARKHVLADFNKTVLPEMYLSKPDIVVFDFIDERFDILRSGDTYITRSED